MHPISARSALLLGAGLAALLAIPAPAAAQDKAAEANAPDTAEAPGSNDIIVTAR